MDRSARVSDADQLEICRDDNWIVIEANFQVSTEQSVVQNLRGMQLGSNSISLSWEAQGTNSITGYDVTCSNDPITNIFHENNGRIEAAILLNISPGNYQCCAVAHLGTSLFGLAESTSTECVSVSVVNVGGENLGPVSGLSTVTYALAGLTALLLLVTIAIAVGCILVVLSKRKYQVTHPRYVHVDTVATRRWFKFPQLASSCYHLMALEIP